MPEFEIVATCASAIDASRVLKTHFVDLLFLDIEMPVLKGTDFYKNLIHKPKVIFTTAHRNYAIDGFELDAIDYLLKPIIFSRFFNAIEKFIATQQSQNITATEGLPTINKDHIFVKQDRKQVKIMVNDITYIQSLKDYIKIHLKNKSHVIKYGITAFEKQLDNNFIRVHRSYIVNINKVTAYTKHDIEIGNIEIPIGENYKAIIASCF
ncbi:MAG: LytTR family DNA-binding domain-containing protein [Xanthomonadales bacterium]|nr:LytTR family DNA-binding domain-containing protein [Xanthomonadales bacterium]